MLGLLKERDIPFTEILFSGIKTVPFSTWIWKWA